MKRILELQLLLSVVLWTLVIGCPPSKEISPCTCHWPQMEGSAFITCKGLDTEQDLVNAMLALRGRDYIYSVTIQDSYFNFVPANVFKGTHLVELSFEGTNLRTLTDTDSAFVGLEDYLEILLITDCVLMSNWEWQIFHKLRRLSRLDIVKTDLQEINEDLQEIKSSASIHDINFNENQIEWLHDNAFASFQNLTVLYLSHNSITQMKRSMLPNPAKYLMDLDFSYNYLDQLPDDMFSNMPKLDHLGLVNNNLLLLNEKTFRPILPQLTFFNAMGNELRCDCRMEWILEIKIPDNIRAICEMPMEVKGKSLKSLKSKDLWCFYMPQISK